MSDAIAVLNAGSSSLKFQVFACAGAEPAVLLRGQIEGIGTRPHLSVKDRHGAPVEDRDLAPEAGTAALSALLVDWIEAHLGGDRLVAAGHRVVHGGTEFRAPVLVTPSVLAKLEALVPLAPLHQPHNLAPIRALAAAHPGLPQVACFDTAFHAAQAPVAQRFALPRDLHDQGIRRYGFHGLSYEYVTGRLAELSPEAAAGKVVVCHLGSGASACAIDGGRSVESSMGFTALDGLVMGTRCGTLDPGVVLHLIQAQGMDAHAVQDLLYKRSGLLGVSGISNDMRDLLASSAPEAAEAVDLFVHRVVREIGALAAGMGGLDALVFTAGIGERSAEIRRRICERLHWLGIWLCPAANEAHHAAISRLHSRASVWVIPTDEERMIARHTLQLTAAAPLALAS